MENDSDDSVRPAIARADAEAELERLFGDARFHLSDRNRAFLRYLAEASFSDPSRGVKAYSVAIDVFGRPSSFDANTDPIVRIEATRLRTSLEQYYEAFGQETSIRIEVPRGSYIAQFHKTERSEPAAEQPKAVAPEILPERVTEKTNHTLQSFAIIVGALVVFVVSLVLAIKSSLGTGDVAAEYVGKPVVTLLQSNVTDTNQEIAAFAENLLIALSRFESLRVRSETDLGPSRAIRRDGNSGQNGLVESEYEIVLQYRQESDAHSLRWRVLDADSGEALATGFETSTTASVAETEAIADKIAIQLAADGGILGSLEMRKGYPADAIGNICVVRGERALNRMDLAGLLAASGCLHATIASNNENSDALATLARVLVAQDEISGGSENIDEARDLVNRAMATEPSSPRSLIARMVVMYAEGQREAARTAGRTAIALNPIDPESAAAFALRLYLSGEREEAMQTLRPVPATNLRTWDEDFMNALDAYLNNRYADAIAQLDGMMHEDSFASALRIAALLRMRQIDAAKRALAGIGSQHPARFLDDVSKIMAARRVDAGIQTRLIGDLAQVKDW
jgi:Flp pilus assembly protein TadD